MNRHLGHSKIFGELSYNLLRSIWDSSDLFEKSIYYLYLISLTEILITQCQDKSLSVEEELVMTVGFQQPSIQNTSYNTIQG